MAEELFTPLEWADGSPETALTAARGPSRWEAAIDALDDAHQDMDSRVSALEGGSSAGLSGPTSGRPAAGVGVRYYDTTIHKPIWGDGSQWRDAAANVVSSGVAAPTSLEAVGQSDNTVDLTWAAVTGADTYKLYSDDEPTGVTGATALVGTSFSTAAYTLLGLKRFWVTATDSAVESPISNYATVTLPISGGDTGGTDSTPADILDIGTGDSQNHFNEGVGYASGHVDKTMSAIIAGYSEDPYFIPNGAGDAVQFQIFMNGGKTSTGTHYPRSELRELKKDGSTKASWTIGSGKTHVMSGTSKVMHLPPNKPWVCFAQIHDGSGDLVRLQVEETSLGAGVGSLRLVARIHAGDSGGTENLTQIKSSYTVGESIDWKIETTGTSVKVYLSNVQKASGTCSVSGCYYKAGCYAQTASTWGGFEDPDEYCTVELKNLVVTHSPAL